MGFGHSRTGTRTDTFTLREGGLVLAEDYSRFLSPASRSWAGSPARDESRWGTSTIPTPPARPFR